MQPFEFIGAYCNSGGNLQSCLQGAYNMGLAIAIALAFLMAVIGAFQYLLGAAINQKDEGKKKILGSIYGLAIIFVSGVVLYWINPSIFSAELITFRVSQLEVPGLGETETVGVLTTQQIQTLQGSGNLGNLTPIPFANLSQVRNATRQTPGRAAAVRPAMLLFLQKINELLTARGVTVQVTSAYRSPQVQQQVNPRASNSLHSWGLALDLVPASGIGMAQLAVLLRDARTRFMQEIQSGRISTQNFPARFHIDVIYGDTSHLDHVHIEIDPD